MYLPIFKSGVKKIAMKLARNFFIYISAIIIISSSIISPLGCINVFADEYVWPEPAEISSEYYVLMDADSGKVIKESNSNEKCYPASVTKLMTALLVVENCNLSDTITISANAVNSVKYGDSTAALKVGEEFSVEQALNIMLIKSANDMAYALGEYVGGTIANFADMMNKKAASLGCTGTQFSNASGLTDIYHYTTAYDMALICREVIDNPIIMDIISYPKTYSCPPTNKTDETRYYRLSHAMNTGRDYAYPYFIGGKTGYTDAAGSTLATFAEKDGLRLICIIFRSTDTGRYEDTTALFDYVYDNFSAVNISENETDFSFDTAFMLQNFGVHASALTSSSNLSISIPEDDHILIPKGIDFGDLTRVVTYNDSGITIYYNYLNNIVGSTSLLLGEKEASDSSLLPYLEDEHTIDVNELISKNQYVSVNIWLVCIALCIIVLIIVLIVWLIERNSRKNYYKIKLKQHKF